MAQPSEKSMPLPANKNLSKSRVDLGLSDSLLNSDVRAPERLRKQLNVDAPDRKPQFADEISERNILGLYSNRQIKPLSLKGEDEDGLDKIFVRDRPKVEFKYADKQKDDEKEGVINFTSFKGSESTDKMIIKEEDVTFNKKIAEKRDPVINQQFQEYERMINNLEVANKNLMDKLKMAEMMNQGRMEDNSIRGELMEQNKHILNQMTELQHINIKLRDELDHLKSDRRQEADYWQIQMETRETRIKQLEKQLNDKKSQLKEYQGEIVAMKQGLEKVDANVTQLFNTKRELGKLKLQLASVEREKLEASLQLEAKQTEITHLKLANERAIEENKHIFALKDALKRLEEENKLLFAKSRSENDEKEQYKNQLSYLQNRIKSLEEENTKNGADQKRIIELLNQVSDQETVNRGFKANLDQQELVYTKKVEEFERYKKNQTSKHDQTLQELSRVSLKFERSLKSIKVDQDYGQVQKIEDLEKENKRLATELQQIIEERETDRQEIDELQLKLKTLNHGMEDREETILHLADRISSLKSELHESKKPVVFCPDENYLINDFLMKVAVDHMYNRHMENDYNIKQSHLITNDTANTLNVLQESLLQSKINEIDKLKAENERLLTYVESYKTNTLEMEEKVHRLIIKYENIRERLKKYESGVGDSRTGSTRNVELEGMFEELREVKMKNRVLEVENKKLNMFMLDRLKSFG